MHPDNDRDDDARRAEGTSPDSGRRREADPARAAEKKRAKKPKQKSVKKGRQT